MQHPVGQPQIVAACRHQYTRYQHEAYLVHPLQHAVLCSIHLQISVREPEPKGVILNELIYVNDGNGKFSKYQEKNLYIDRIKPYQIFPYMRNGRLHFIGFSFKSDPNLSPNNIPFKEGKVPIIFYDIELDL